MEQIPSNKVATATQRRQLQMAFERAQQLKNGSTAEREEACELFRKCFAADPGNLIYAQSWLSAIEEFRRAIKGKSPNPLKSFFLARAVKKAKTHRQWPQVIELASLHLANDNRSLRFIEDLSEACLELGHDHVAILLLRRATEIDVEGEQNFRRLACALESVGDLAGARQFWLRVRELCPGDDQAARGLRAVEQGQGGNIGPENPQDEIAASATGTPQSVEECLQQVEELVSNGRFEKADEHLRRAVSLHGSEIRLQERLEQLLIDQVQYEIVVAESRLEENRTPESHSLLDGLRSELNRREIDFYAIRSQRHPEQSQLKLELGLRLKRAGIYAEAIAELVDLLEDRKLGGVASVETGECWQGLRQFDRALNFYRDAMKKCPDSNECFQRSRYRAAVLLEAMGNLQQAESLLEEVVRTDSNYKDAASRLDKIKKSRHHS